MNQALFSFFYGLAHHSPFLDVIFIFCAKFLVYFLVLGFVYLLFKEKNPMRRYYFLFLTLLAVLFSWGMVSPAIHFYYPHPRPFAAVGGVNPLITPSEDSSFPSNHMMFLVPIVLAAAYLDPKRGKWFIIGVLLVGIGRIIAGVHWPFDILAGIALGAICFYIARAVIARTGLKEKTEEKIQP